MFIGPELKRIGGMIRERGPSDLEAAQRIARLVVISRIDLVVLLIVVAAMVLKPGL